MRRPVLAALVVATFTALAVQAQSGTARTSTASTANPNTTTNAATTTSTVAEPNTTAPASSSAEPAASTPSGGSSDAFGTNTTTVPDTNATVPDTNATPSAGPGSPFANDGFVSVIPGTLPQTRFVPAPATSGPQGADVAGPQTPLFDEVAREGLAREQRRRARGEEPRVYGIAPRTENDLTWQIPDDRIIRY